MIGATFCSGIGAPEMAAPWADWRFASEIAPFPREVLQRRFGYTIPADHNQGAPLLWDDMAEVTPDLLRSRGIPLPDLIVAGTPCQAFSVAGARKGLEDKRGNLTLTFVEILHAIVDARPDGKLAVLWENVPGVLSDKGNAFGCFLGGIVGAVDALPCPADGSWPSEGMVEGPRARAAWCVLDAQWFGVAQRRRRVFVVVDFGNCVDPAAVLLEPDCMRGNSAPRREAGQGAARGVEFGPSGGGFTDVNPTLDTRCKDGPIRNQLAGAAIHCAEIASTLNAAFGSKLGLEDQHINSGAPLFVSVAHSLRGEGFDASEDGTGRGTPLIPVAGAICRDSFSGGAGGRPEGAAVGHFLPVAFDCKGTQVQFSADGTHPTLRSMGHADSHQNAGGHAAIAFAVQERAISENPNSGPDGKGWQADHAYTLEARSQVQSVATPWAVRRLIPKECSRLQGFPDDHTAITVRGKPAADGPQYKALGNSMAVPVIAWIMERMRISMEDTA